MHCCPRGVTQENINLVFGLPVIRFFIYHIFMANTGKKIICICCLLSVSCIGWGAVFPFSFGKKTIRTDYSNTVWDQIMQDQSLSDMRRGLGEMGLSRYKEAQNSFAKAVIKNPKDPLGFLLLGAALYWSGKVDEAMSEYREALTLDPKNALAYQLLGIAYGWKGDLEQAQEYFKKSYELEPDKSDTNMNLASTYAAQKNWEKALEHYRRAVELAPREPLYHYQLGSLYERMGRDAQAEDSFKKALSLFWGYEDAMLSLGALYEKTGDDAAALKYYKKAVRTKPGDFVARLLLAKLYYQQGEAAKAREVLDGAFSIIRFKQEGLALNAVYRSSGRTAEAFAKEIENFRNNLSRVPAAKDINVDVSLEYAPLVKPKEKPSPSAGSFERAYQKLRSSSALPGEQEVPPMAFKRSFVLAAATQAQRENQINEFIEGLENAVKQGEGKYDVTLSLQGRTMDYASPSALTQQNSSAPRAAYDPRIVGNDMGLWVTGKSWLALVQAALEDLSSGDKALSAEQTSLLTGLAYLVAGDAAQASQSFAQARSLAPADDLPLMGLGTASVIAGNDAQAKDFYNQALRLNPKNKTAKKNLNVLQEE